MSSSPTPSAIHAGSAPVSLSRTSPSPGASTTTSTSTPSASTTCRARRSSRRGSNSRGIVDRAALGQRPGPQLEPFLCAHPIRKAERCGEPEEPL